MSDFIFLKSKEGECVIRKSAVEKVVARYGDFKSEVNGVPVRETVEEVMQKLTETFAVAELKPAGE